MSQLDAIAKHWDNQTIKPQPSRVRWWQSRRIIRHINRIVCGQPIDGLSAGFHKLLKQTRPQGYDRAVSVGCGAGYKEAQLVMNGVVQHFHLYEISAERIKLGQEFAKEHGIADRMHFISENGAATCQGQYDLVYWNNALHHMMDVPSAVAWSRERLVPGGVFAMDDYIGASRFQWSDYSLEVATRFRESLSPEHLRGAPTTIERPTLASMIAIDPSEAADSERIIAAVSEIFPTAQISFTGGAIYHTALNDILVNMDEDSESLSLALLLDEVLARQGESQYGTAIAVA